MAMRVLLFGHSVSAVFVAAGRGGRHFAPSGFLRTHSLSIRIGRQTSLKRSNATFLDFGTQDACQGNARLSNSSESCGTTFKSACARVYEPYERPNETGPSFKDEIIPLPKSVRRICGFSSIGWPVARSGETAARQDRSYELRRAVLAVRSLADSDDGTGLCGVATRRKETAHGAMSRHCRRSQRDRLETPEALASSATSRAQQNCPCVTAWPFRGSRRRCLGGIYRDRGRSREQVEGSC